MCRYFPVCIDWRKVSPTTKYIDGPTVTGADAPLTITAPGKVTEREGFILWSLDNLVCFDRAKGVGYASIVRLLILPLLFGLSVTRACTDGG